MPTSTTTYRVFIASPGGLEPEREAFRDLLREYNETEAVPRGALFVPVGWEDTPGGIGRPQGLIDQEVRTCDFFVLVLHDRWGSPPDDEGRFTSGSEEEFSLAVELARDGSMKQVLVLFKGVPVNQLSDPGPQLTRVLDFRRKLERERGHLYRTFDDLASFRRVLRQHLAAWLRWHEQGADAPRSSADLPEQPSSPTEEADGEEEPAETADDPDVRQMVAEAEKLAAQGRRTDAEALFAISVVRSQQPWAFVAYGAFLVHDGRLSQAAEILDRAAWLARLKGVTDAESAALNSLARVHSIRGDLEEAEKTLRAAVALDERHGWLPGLAVAYGNLGRVLQDRGDLAESEEMLRRALELNTRLGRTAGIAVQTANLGSLQLRRGDVEGARESFRRALDLNLELDRPDATAGCFMGLGLVHEEAGELAAAEEMYASAQRIYQRLGQVEGLVNAYGNLGNVRRARGDLEGAEELYSLALEIARRVGMKRLEKKALNALDTVRPGPGGPAGGEPRTEGE